MPAALFRADASPMVGGGHVMRCLTLAQALAGRGWDCAFAAAADTGAAAPALAQSGFAVLETGAGALEPEMVAGRDLLVIDHYAIGATDERRVRGRVGRIAVIDDLADRDHDCDVLLDQNPGREAADYRDRVPAGCRLLLGARHALLRPAFAAARAGALARRRPAAAPRRLLVGFGMTDPHDLTSLALAAVEMSGLDVEVDVILGGGAPHLDAVRDRAARAPFAARVHTDLAADRVAAVMAAADLALGSAGGTAWERCTLGLPTLIVMDADNQRQGCAALAATGAARVVGRHGQVTAADLAGALGGLAADPARLAAMAEAAAAICDGDGLRRVVEALAA
ncbi:MAG: UDP-2,4-diacetamido-2,4,6-trideoxy-beta-L-altropyranose hydrolase [Hyphomicrobiales bacterium]|nr:UDP-2,4-diacetamido-2,4,6-trideoxy-beta-L-altropyranose hydrolase [Hyphomicrobiales bacterium]